MTATDKFWGFFLLFFIAPATLVAYFHATAIAVVLAGIMLLVGVHLMSRQKRRCHACGQIFNLNIKRWVLLSRRKLDCPRCNSRIRKSS